jgi:ABC-type multidrug transport system ATPase subunit
MIIIADGQKVADGTAEELEAQGMERSRFVVGLVLGDSQDAGTARSSLAGIPGVANVESLPTRDNGHRFAVDAEGEQDLSQAIFEWAQSSGSALVELRRDVVDLEKIFHKLTQY